MAQFQKQSLESVLPLRGAMSAVEVNAFQFVFDREVVMSVQDDVLMVPRVDVSDQFFYFTLCPFGFTDV
jgi:hypothetical protein